MAKFETGATVMTRGIDESYKKSKKFWIFVLDCFFQRYMNADWGELDDEDKQLNDYALKHDGRLVASYNIPEDIRAIVGQDKIWIITEWDRSVTTILFPEEY